MAKKEGLYKMGSGVRYTRGANASEHRFTETNFRDDWDGSRAGLVSATTTELAAQGALYADGVTSVVDTTGIPLSPTKLMLVTRGYNRRNGGTISTEEKSSIDSGVVSVRAWLHGDGTLNTDDNGDPRPYSKTLRVLYFRIPYVSTSSAVTGAILNQVNTTNSGPFAIDGVTFRDNTLRFDPPSLTVELQGDGTYKYTHVWNFACLTRWSFIAPALSGSVVGSSGWTDEVSAVTGLPQSSTDIELKEKHQKVSWARPTGVPS